LKKEDSNHRVIVTGADGFLGSNIVRELLSRDYEVYGLVQNGRDANTLEGLPVKLFHGDLSNQEDLEPLFRDCDYIIHTAGLTALWPSKSKISWEVNYNAVKLLVKLAKKYQTKRFIHIGTANSFGHGPKSNPGTENMPYNSDKLGLDYQDSKYRAQEYLINEAKTNDFPAIILNPTFMLGPYDSGNGSNKMILEVYRHNIPGYGPGGKNYVHVKDVASAAVNAIQQGRLGECYIIGNENLSFKEVFMTIAETLDVNPPKLPLPKFLAFAYGALSVLMAHITGKQPKLTYKMARLGYMDCYYTPQKAIKELNLTQTPIEEAIMESYIWFKEKGQIS
jgi:dihydroflavonol-4-reductase